MCRKTASLAGPKTQFPPLLIIKTKTNARLQERGPKSNMYMLFCTGSTQDDFFVEIYRIQYWEDYEATGFCPLSNAS